MNNKLYGNLIFELSQKGRRGYSLPKNQFGHHEMPADEKRSADAELPECDEMTVVRHYTNLSENNFGVNNGFYPLGSCTMKYNPTINEEICNLPAFTNLHPLQPLGTCQGALEIEYNLQQALAEISGLSDFTLNPCAGAHGELTGLMIIRSYHQARHDNKRTKVIVPDSAHGTNPASAAVCGLEIVEVKSTVDGLVDVEDLKPLLGDDIAAIMMTNPNTLGLFETKIPEIEKLVHGCGALMYYDGANLNPMLGAARPGDMGFDVMHINLHKTFSTPHGGGGPGSGPVGVREGLEEFLPSPHVVKEGDKFTLVENHFNHVGPYLGNFSVIVRAYTYILTLGYEHLKRVGPLATLNANYIKECLKDAYELPIKGLCKHEFVFNGLKDKSTGVTTMDIAKRLLDFGYHAPTIYFPLLFHEAMMIEPTENESKETIDGFIDVMHRIAKEAIETPDIVKSAPHDAPIRRVDDVLAAKNPILTYKQLVNDEN
ncbi:aminomethyl-transferring glycine dehydrogenase subunit GcvPB [Prevotella sp. oral taxon 376]|uniref:aminomethyl-transferring glycine dehydrogenase subunit GcvPB n=1 Tax=Prevotella sp. oral taxon 376 TaxID=712466 RepID=UPI000D1FD58F|nr:aminomethyl-transferring glycine dehydrogenase subunit GcvPB [Prevotella sp. oral taxon 376]PTL33185.1 aminomethyl-transferring glycine dehydrogenase subunit GcvPB [Prevotella sp. oral taxon 376]